MCMDYKNDTTENNSLMIDESDRNEKNENEKKDSIASSSYSYSYSNGYVPFKTVNGEDVGKKKKKGKGVKGFFMIVAAVAAVAIIFLGGYGTSYFLSESPSQSEIKEIVDNNESTLPTVSTSEAGNTDAASGGSVEKSDIKEVNNVNSSVVVTDVTTTVKEVMPSIVSVSSTVTSTYQTYFGQAMKESAPAEGSGIIVAQNSSELLIATNYHVIESSDVGSISIKFSDGSVATANLKGKDADMDLAIVAVALSDLSSDTLKNIKIASLGDSSSLQLGEPVIAIGNALGYGQSVTTGVVSAIDREVQSKDGNVNTYIQTDAAINPGNSGGALFNSKGEVIGINSAKIGGESVEGMGFAIPISAAEPILSDLMNKETKFAVAEENRGYLGIKVATPTGVEGAYIVEVISGGSADKAGLMVGDIITSIEGESVSSADDLTSAIKYYEAGKTVKVTVLRKGESGYSEVNIDVTLAGANVFD